MTKRVFATESQLAVLAAVLAAKGLNKAAKDVSNKELEALEMQTGLSKQWIHTWLVRQRSTRQRSGARSKTGAVAVKSEPVDVSSVPMNNTRAKRSRVLGTKVEPLPDSVVSFDAASGPLPPSSPPSSPSPFPSPVHSKRSRNADNHARFSSSNQKSGAYTPDFDAYTLEIDAFLSDAADQSAPSAPAASLLKRGPFTSVEYASEVTPTNAHTDTRKRAKYTSTAKAYTPRNREPDNTIPGAPNFNKYIRRTRFRADAGGSSSPPQTGNYAPLANTYVPHSQDRIPNMVTGSKAYKPGASRTIRAPIQASTPYSTNAQPSERQPLVGTSSETPVNLSSPDSGYYSSADADENSSNVDHYETSVTVDADLSTLVVPFHTSTVVDKSGPVAIESVPDSNPPMDVNYCPPVLWDWTCGSMFIDPATDPVGAALRLVALRRAGLVW
ncbi:hypothetical protein BV22DRAFT_1127100 [Leucogyrophana mollusca]|uniref:Uncharacterized protein n=1 Tax=Leucogyrophana mollusca TaxID=85980 RepID=A0ACB8BRA2_9AGAM|nr:hypothetical protein BV22DRAFT_1127100 [Leucogyrophana mollusca]